MKLMLFLFIVLTVILTSVPAQAQGTLTLYDNFEAKSLDPTKWFGAESFGTGAIILESMRQIKTEPTFGYKGLDILNRVYGDTTSDNGTSEGLTRLLFLDGTNVTTIQAKVQVERFRVTVCAGNPSPSEARARIGGLYFNTGPRTPGSATNDVFACIMVRRLSNSLAAPDVLDVVAYAFHCSNQSCSNGTFMGTGTLGTVVLGQRVKLRITWDQANHQFIFQKGKKPEVILPYNPTTFPDTLPPGASNGGNKRLDVDQTVASCTSQPRPVAFMEAFFDDVYVNP